MATNSNHRLKVILAFALVYVFWGSTYLAIGIADDEHLPPFVMCAIRFLIAGPIMMAACAVMGRNIRVTRQQLGRLAMIGCLLLVGGNGGLAWAEQYVPTGFAALIIAITPIWFVLLEAFVFRGDRLSRRGVAGVVLGILRHRRPVLAEVRISRDARHHAVGLLHHAAVLVVQLGVWIGAVAQVATGGRSLRRHCVGDDLRRTRTHRAVAGHRAVQACGVHPARNDGGAVSRRSSAPGWDTARMSGC